MTDLPAGSGNRITTASFQGTWADLGAADPAWPAASAFLVDDHLQALRAVWAHAAGGRETLIAGSGRVGDEQAAGFQESGLALVRADGVSQATADHDVEDGRVWLLTSGSTGRPKQVAHTLDSLTTVAGQQPARTWLCPYAVGAYAWWQVVTLSLNLPGQDVLFIEPSQLEQWPQLALDAGVTAASGTPTFWRQALWRSGEVMAKLPLEQVTLGGEPVDQAILDRLREVYPDARISWIYASSEAGAAIAVHDGKAGFPQAWLDREVEGRPRLSVQDGELVIASSKAAEGMDAEIRTGDHVEIEDGRVVITGRIASDEINVGGSKASASKVRGVLLDHPAVVWASVKGRKAPLVGMVVAAEVVLDRDAASDQKPVTDADLQSWCAERLPDYSVPRRIRVRDEIPLKETLKSDV
ncbi:MULTISPECIES: class I adenylate-forming enzyme family protein [Yimella]|uniref:Acyl-CoA synthetase (AMP-forming)/AMP-acid ligase II n=1 Tax=Yimella lutea TaxID=587872 RepID=A0A542EJZ4_9MICO|nr:MULTISPECIES: class I adenylate-forming enzyme family protein [Yimella]MCG8654663.1 acyl--CoA ligase [Yimella sp. NH-Cas1]RYG76972.1 long-chain fatty acid--CoA ligase [Yimella sp. RIT 621]TQJ15516.1 acyl-CoA synthetase (AMP-forming)/AMP-acid ligase II [Yimella lutea]